MSEVLGLAATLAMFERLAAAVEPATGAATSAIAQEVATSARSKATVLTGALRDSIQALPDRVVVGVDSAGHVEFGTSTAPAEPYLRPAADEAEGHQAAAEVQRILGGI